MTKREELLSLIKKLELPVLSGELDALLAKLTDDEISSLIFVYRAFWRYQQALDETLRREEPQSYQKLEDEHRQKIAEIEENYTRETEEIQKKVDQKADRSDEKDLYEVKEKVAQIEAVKNESIRTQQDFIRKLNSSV